MGLGAGCLLFGAFGGWTYYQGMGLRAELAGKQSALEQAQAQIRALEAKLKKSETAVAAAKAEAAVGASAPENSTEVTAAPAPAAAEGEPVESKKKISDLMKGPFGEMISKQTVSMMYGDLLKEMVLTPQEREAFHKILVEETMASQRSAEEYKAITDPKLKASYYTDRQKETEAKVQALLGDQRLAQYKTYKGQIGERMMVKQFESQIAMSQNPLAPDQKKQLIQVMTEERDKLAIESKGENGKPDIMENQRALNQRINARLGTVLMPEQLKELNRWQDSMAQLMEQAVKKMDEAKTEGE